MTEIERIVRELADAHGGKPWHGPSRARVLADVALEEAARHPSPHGHSIWSLVLHMSAWTGEVARRLREGQPREPGAGDWPSAPAPTAQAWRETLAALDRAHRDLIATVRSLQPERLDDRGASADDVAVGGTMTNRMVLHGLAQHDAYHTGQIALLKRIYRDGTS